MVGSMTTASTSSMTVTMTVMMTTVRVYAVTGHPQLNLTCEEMNQILVSRGSEQPERNHDLAEQHPARQ